MTTTFGGLIGHGARGDLHTAGRFCNDFLIAADKTDFLELNWFWVSLLQLNLTNPSKNLDNNDNNNNNRLFNFTDQKDEDT